MLLDEACAPHAHVHEIIGGLERRGWQVDLREIHADRSRDHGRLYYLSRPGRTFVLAAKPEYELLAANDLGERGTFNASPAVAGSKLYLRSDKFLYCLGKK